MDLPGGHLHTCAHTPVSNDWRGPAPPPITFSCELWTGNAASCCSGPRSSACGREGGGSGRSRFWGGKERNRLGAKGGGRAAGPRGPGRAGATPRARPRGWGRGWAPHDHGDVTRGAGLAEDSATRGLGRGGYVTRGDARAVQAVEPGAAGQVRVGLLVQQPRRLLGPQVRVDLVQVLAPPLGFPLPRQGVRAVRARPPRAARGHGSAARHTGRGGRFRPLALTSS